MSSTSLPTPGQARHGQRAVTLLLGLFSTLLSLGLAALALGFIGSIGFAASAPVLPAASETIVSLLAEHDE